MTVRSNASTFAAAAFLPLALLAFPALPRPAAAEEAATAGDESRGDRGGADSAPDQVPAAQETKKPPAEVITRTEYVFLKENEKKKSILLLEPRAISLMFLFERFRAGSETLRGTSIEPDEDLGMDSMVFLLPDINMEIETRVFGLRARLRFSFTDNTLHGLKKLGRPVAMSRTVFPADTVVGSTFTQRCAEVRYFQELVESDLILADLALGADYMFFRNVIDAPGFAREKDVTEAAIPILGARASYRLTEWGILFLRADGMYWNLGRETGATGIFEAAAGISVKFSERLGFEIEFSMDLRYLRKGRRARVEIDYVGFGPGISVYAKL